MVLLVCSLKGKYTQLSILMKLKVLFYNGILIILQLLFIFTRFKRKRLKTHVTKHQLNETNYTSSLLTTKNGKQTIIIVQQCSLLCVHLNHRFDCNVRAFRENNEAEISSYWFRMAVLKTLLGFNVSTTFNLRSIEHRDYTNKIKINEGL